MTERHEIRYLDPLDRAWAGMVDRLFRPFDLARWFVLGFACWLARLGQGGIPSFNLPLGDLEDDADAAPLLAAGSPFDSADWTEAVAIGCALLVVLLLLILIPLVIWLSSRGQFIFLDDVVNRRAEIVRPWREFRREGNSLFLWQLLFALIALVSLVLLALPGAFLIYTAQRDGDSLVPGIALLAAPILVWIVVLMYVGFFLLAFVVPIMHRERLRTNDAWRVFLPVLKAEWARFLAVGLFVAGLHVLLGIAILVVGLATCCLGFLVLIIPYVGTVALLPVWVTYRLFTVEFLAQFASRFDFFDRDVAVFGPPPPPEPPPEPLGPPPMPLPGEPGA